MTDRFEYIAFNKDIAIKHKLLKLKYRELEELIEKEIPHTRQRSLAYTSLEESFMWCGKALRDMQLEIEKKNEG